MHPPGGGPGGFGPGGPPGPGFFFGGPWGPPPFLFGWWWGPDWWRCPGLPLLIFLLLWGITYGIFALIINQECGSATDPSCASTYGIGAGIIFFVLLFIYICVMMMAIRPPPHPYHSGVPGEDEPLLTSVKANPPVAVVTVEKV